MSKFECTVHSEFTEHIEVRFDCAGTPGGHVMLRLPKGAELPVLGRFYEVDLWETSANAAPVKTGPVDVTGPSAAVPVITEPTPPVAQDIPAQVAETSAQEQQTASEVKQSEDKSG